MVLSVESRIGSEFHVVGWAPEETRPSYELSRYSASPMTSLINGVFRICETGGGRAAQEVCGLWTSPSGVRRQSPGRGSGGR